MRLTVSKPCRTSGEKKWIGSGILLDFHVIKHMADVEAVHTFEGTETMQTLIVGRDITGIGAFT